ncbi:MAG: hypothetical protein RI564_08135 [Gracilimonas sp.]|jgi:hypothetical protein|nr:hypothetical protein [Gracilimonas sp.]
MKYIVQSVIILMISIGYTGEVAAQERPNPNIPQGNNMEVPEGWEVRLDKPSQEVIIGDQPDSSDIYFVNMTPGWHITSGPAGIYYHPANTTEGNFSIQTEIHFFDPGDRNREAYGLFWGGKNLQDPEQSYYYFLIRNTGEYLIKKRSGESTSVLKNWTAADTIQVFDAETEGSSVLNVLSISVQDEQIVFEINEEKVEAISSEEIESQGIFGLRVNHSINVHISDLAVISE